MARRGNRHGVYYEPLYKPQPTAGPPHTARKWRWAAVLWILVALGYSAFLWQYLQK